MYRGSLFTGLLHPGFTVTVFLLEFNYSIRTFRESYMFELDFEFEFEFEFELDFELDFELKKNF